jgi:hypothetical protein
MNLMGLGLLRGLFILRLLSCADFFMAQLVWNSWHSSSQPSAGKRNPEDIQSVAANFAGFLALDALDLGCHMPVMRP